MDDKHVDKKPKVERNEQTFLLAYPKLVDHVPMGCLVSFFEKINLKLQGMRLMHANEKFIAKHFENVGGQPKGNHPYHHYNSWLVYLNSKPVVAMILEGHDAVNRVNEIASKQEESLFWAHGGPTCYSSNSDSRASQDIEMWFHEDRKDWLEQLTASEHLICVHPEGIPYGPWKPAYEILQKNIFVDSQPNLPLYFPMADMSVVVIKHKAFREFCVGDILRAVEVNCFSVRGLKLLKKADCPESAVWSDSCTPSETEGDECALAMVADSLEPDFEFLLDEAYASNIDSKFGSNYIYKSKPHTLCHDMADFFPYGLILWVSPQREYVCGKVFEASLIGLLPQEDQVYM